MATGGKRLEKMIRGGVINKSGLWIDTYNQTTSEIAGTIKARIDTNCMYFVSVEKSSAPTDLDGIAVARERER